MNFERYEHQAFVDVVPTWRLLSQGIPRPGVYLVGRAIYNDTQPKIDMALFGPAGEWLNMSGQPLSFEPNWFAEAPCYPPWPPEGFV